MRASAVLRSVIYRTLAVALAALAVLSTIMPAPAFAAGSDQQVKTVRVGWLVSNEGFQDGTPASASRDGVTSTSRPCRTIRPAGSTNTSPAPSPNLWTCSRRAKSTSCPTSPTPRNAQKLLFSSNPEGTERYYIYARPDRDDLAKGDPQALQGLPSAATPALCKPSLASSGSPTKESPAHTRSMTEDPISLTRSQTTKSMPSS